jgi:hypothetical protein
MLIDRGGKIHVDLEDLMDDLKEERNVISSVPHQRAVNFRLVANPVTFLVGCS